MRPEGVLTCISLGHKEHHDTLLRGEVRDLDVLVLLVLESQGGQDAPNVDGRQGFRFILLLLNVHRFGIRPGLMGAWY